MYSIIASKIGYTKIAYDMFYKSASIDLGTDQKMYAGGIYIGGTHPASNAGAYLSALIGFAGLWIKEDEFVINPHLPPSIEGIRCKFIYKNKQYLLEVNKDNSYKIEEVNKND